MKDPNQLNWFEKWLLKRTFKKVVKQGFYHDIHITNLYNMIREATHNEFTEDNTITLDSNLKHWFEQSLKEK